MFDGKYPDFFILDSFLEKYRIYFKFGQFVKTNLNIGLTDSYLINNYIGSTCRDRVAHFLSERVTSLDLKTIETGYNNVPSPE